MLDAHLGRLAASAREVYGIEPPADVARRIGAVGGDARVRVILLPDGRTTVEAHPLTPSPATHGFAPFLLPGGLGAHKWADRRLATALDAAAGDRVALIVDGDGAVLEATWANVFLVEGDRLVTPPADGRILPGVRRATVAATEEAIGLDRLEAADEVFLTSALRRYSPSSAEYSRS